VKNGSTMLKAIPGGRARSPFRRSAPGTGQAGPQARQVIWVYAVTADLAADQVCGLTGVAGEPVRVVTESGLGAVVGSVNDEQFGERSRGRLLANLSRIELVGRAHHKVVACTASAGPVVPLRLATTYPDDATIRTLLAAHRAELTTMLQAFSGRQEWGVKVYAKPWANAASGSGATVPGELDPSRPGREWRWVTAEAWAEKIGQALSAIAVATRRNPSPGPPPDDRTRWPLLHAAYLLSTERADEFGETVRALTAQNDALRADVTGPWPPYSFAEPAG
jgi:hypothetical protein